MSGSKQSSVKCLLQRTELSLGFHCARVRWTCFVHSSLKPSIFERKRPGTAVLEDDGATSSGDGGRKRAAFEKRERSQVKSD